MAAGRTYTPISSTTSIGSTSTVTFSSIPQTYTDLILVMQLFPTTSQDFITRVGNNSADSGSNYSHTYLYGNGSTVSSSRGSNQTSILGGWGNRSTQGTHLFYFNNYSNTTTYKTVLMRLNDTGDGTTAAVNLWRSTSAINIITIAASTGNFASGSTFTLYGIAAA